MKSKKILFVNPSVDMYGADRILLLVMQFYVDKGYEIGLVAPKNGPLIDAVKSQFPSADISIDDAMPLIERAIFTPLGIVKTVLKTVRWKWLSLTRYKSYKTVYINTLANFLFAPVFMGISRKVITHVHEIIEKPALVQKVTSFVSLLFSKQVVVVSEAVRRRFISSMPGFLTPKVTVIHNGIPPRAEKGSAERREKLALLLVGRLMPEKGQWFLLDTLKDLKEETLKAIHVTLLGSPTEKRAHLKSEFQSLVSQYGLEEVVTQIDYTPDVASYLQKTDVVLVPSIMADPFPTTVLEGFSAAKPVIATDHGGAAEVIEHHKSGVLISKGDTQAFGEAINYFLKHPDSVTDFGDNAYTTYKNTFTLDAFMKRLEDKLIVK